MVNGCHAFLESQGLQDEAGAAGEADGGAEEGDAEVAHGGSISQSVISQAAESKRRERELSLVISSIRSMLAIFLFGVG